MKKLLIIIILLSSNSCSWISQDYYFANNVKTEGWSHKFKSGKTSGKKSGYPDSVIFEYGDSSYKINISSSFQVTTFFGPILLPIFPTFFEHNEYVSFDIIIDSNLKISLEPSQWTVIDINKNKKHFPVSIYEFNVNSNPKRFAVLYDIKNSDHLKLKLEFSDIFIGDKKVVLPPVFMEKTKGSWHFESLTV